VEAKPPDAPAAVRSAPRGNCGEIAWQLSQEAFATRFGISLRTLQQWEQKRRFPDGPTMLLLSIIRHEPEAVERVVKRYHTPDKEYGKPGG
jgi:hypothetical protein